MTTNVQNVRDFPRAAVRTPAFVFIPNDRGGLQRVRGWTDDLSPSGALLLTEKPVTADEFYIRVALPGLRDTLFECRQVRQGPKVVRTLSSLEDLTRYTYGLQFIGVCQDADLIAATLDCR